MGINHNFDKKQYKMKLALATLALVQANEDPRAFVNVDGFMTSTPVTWWNKHPAEKRLKWLENNVDKFFETHFVGNWVWETPGANNPGMNLRQHFRKYVSQMKTIEARCKPGSRKRRDEDEAEGQANSNDEEEDADFMETSTGDRTRKVTGNIVKDVDRFTKNLARWAKYEIYDQGGNCEFYGLRLVKTSSFCSTRFKHNLSLIAWTVSAGTLTTATAKRSIAQSTSVTSTTGPPMA